MTAARRTYTERRTYSARVMRFRQNVYGKRDGLTAGCRVLLLRLSDDMDAKCIVSIPRSALAAEFGVAPARITEWVTLGRELGFLSVVKRARPGTTAVYQGLCPQSGVRQDVPQDNDYESDLEVRKTGPNEVRQTVPLQALPRYARAVPQEVVRDDTGDQSLEREPWETERRYEEDGAQDSAFLSALENLGQTCPHGIPGGAFPDPWVDDRNPSCPECHREAYEAEQQEAERFA